MIHRDVKPQNIILQYTNTHRSDESSLGDDRGDEEKKTSQCYPELWLIDWGLAEFYIPGKEFNVRVASRYYKSPELLISLQDYDYSLDMFSAGCLLGSMVSVAILPNFIFHFPFSIFHVRFPHMQLFGKEPLFKGDDNNDQLVKIAKVLGTDGLRQYLNKYGLDLPAVYDNVMKDYPRVPWSAFVRNSNFRKCTDDALDLLTKLLQYDHQVFILSFMHSFHRLVAPYCTGGNVASFLRRSTGVGQQQYANEIRRR